MTEPTTARIHLSMREAIAELTIDNPGRRNAMTLAMWCALPALLTEAAALPGVRVVLLRGAGDGPFTAGADISEFGDTRTGPADNRAYEDATVLAFRALAACRKPTVAVIRGACMGAGVGLAAACDLRIASADAVFAIPAGRLGVGYPPDAMAALVATLGVNLTRALFLTAGRIDAPRALAAGFLWQVVAAERLEQDARYLADDIAANAPMTLRAARDAIAAAAGLATHTAEALQAAADACFASEDFREGLAAFGDGRRPHFEGR